MNLDLNVEDKNRISATTCLRWVKQYGSDEQFVAQSPHFHKKGQARNRLEAESCTRSLDLAINEYGWKATVNKNRTEVDARRLLELEICSSGKPWEVASLLEENLSTRRKPASNYTGRIDLSLSGDATIKVGETVNCLSEKN